MVEIEEALTTYLLAQSDLTALIGRRFFYDELPQGTTLPAVVCQCVDDIKSHTHDGQSKLESPNYQYTAYASTRSGARAIANKIKAALCDYVGVMSGIKVQYITLLNELPNTEATSDGSITVHTVDLEFEINFIKE